MCWVLYEVYNSVCKLESFCRADDAFDGGGGGKEGYVHIRLQQRNNRQKLTTVQGIPDKFDLKKIVAACRKLFGCNGFVVDDKTHGEVMQFQGDQRDVLVKFIVGIGFVPESHIKVHGF